MILQRHPLGWLLVLALGGAPGCRPPPTADPAESLGAAIDSLAAPYLASRSLSGVVAVTRGSGPALVRSYGQATLDPATQTTPTTRFMIGSVSKSFTAAVVLALRARGALELDTVVGRYLENFPHGDSITVRQLLAHQSGLGNLFFLPNYGELAQSHHSPAEVVKLVAHQPLSFSPGSRTAYNNVNYTALAWLIEVRSGLSYAEAVASELLRPLGLGQTVAVERAGQPIPELAQGTDPIGMTGIGPARFNDPSIFAGSGSMASTALDLSRWLAAIADGRVISGPELELLLDFARLREEFRGRPAISASGWDGVGFAAHAIHLPGDSLTVAVLLNVNIAGIAGEVAEGVAALALGEAPSVAPLALGPLPMDSLERLTGVYRFGRDFYVPEGTLRLVARDGGLYDVGREPEIGLLPLADGDFLYRSTWSRVHFVPGGGDNPPGLIFAGRFEATRLPDEPLEPRR